MNANRLPGLRAWPAPIPVPPDAASKPLSEGPSPKTVVGCFLAGFVSSEVARSRKVASLGDDYVTSGIALVDGESAPDPAPTVQRKLR